MWRCRFDEIPRRQFAAARAGCDNSHRLTEMRDKDPKIMSRNALYLAIGILIVAGLTVSYQLYSEQQNTGRVEISVGKHGISIERK